MHTFFNFAALFFRLPSNGTIVCDGVGRRVGRGYFCVPKILIDSNPPGCLHDHDNVGILYSFIGSEAGQRMKGRGGATWVVGVVNIQGESLPFYLGDKGLETLKFKSFEIVFKAILLCYLRLNWLY